MSFKIHLIIIGFIIVTVFLAWYWIAEKPAPVAVEPPHQESPFSIAITHASWGLNCMDRGGSKPSTPFDPYAKTSSPADNKLHEDNVLIQVSALCNGQVKCVIPLKGDALGDDPSPGCPDKALEVEYRCFSYDRPWSVRATSGKLTINCDNTSQ